MVIKKKQKHNKIEIDLTGPEGNAFCLLGYAKTLCKATGKEWEGISKNMQSGSYENLIKVFEKEFGDFVVMYR